MVDFLVVSIVVLGGILENSMLFVPSWRRRRSGKPNVNAPAFALQGLWGPGKHWLIVFPGCLSVAAEVLRPVASLEARLRGQGDTLLKRNLIITRRSALRVDAFMPGSSAAKEGTGKLGVDRTA
jgi:hypothetical protein